jgi:hypothetical protein
MTHRKSQISHDLGCRLLPVPDRRQNNILNRPHLSEIRGRSGEKYGDRLFSRGRSSTCPPFPQDWLFANTTGAKRLRTGLPTTWRVGDKTGTGQNGSSNDVAIVWPPNRPPILIAVYLTESKASADDCNGAIAAVGRIVTESFCTSP